MRIEKYNDAQGFSEDIKTLDQLFEKVKTPKELLGYMDKNIEYGYIGAENKKINSSKDYDNQYHLQSPEELVKSKCGVCWDQVELERKWFSKNDFEPETYFLMFAKEEKKRLPTHTFLVYKNEDKFCWFENSFGTQRGIHEYENLSDLISDVKSKQFEYAKSFCGATDDDFEIMKSWKYEQPKYGIKSSEYINYIRNTGIAQQQQ